MNNYFILFYSSAITKLELSKLAYRLLTELFELYFSKYAKKLQYCIKCQYITDIYLNLGSHQASHTHGLKLCTLYPSCKFFYFDSESNEHT